MPPKKTNKTSLETLKSDLAQAQALQMRALADLENFKRRSEQEKKQWSILAVVQMLKPLLPSFLELSLGAEHTNDKGIKTVTEKFFMNLEKAGIKKINPKLGDALDPQKHEVILSEQSKKPGIVRCLEIGWQYQDYVIIPAKVSAQIS